MCLFTLHKTHKHQHIGEYRDYMRDAICLMKEQIEMKQCKLKFVMAKLNLNEELNQEDIKYKEELKEII